MNNSELDHVIAFAELRGSLAGDAARAELAALRAHIAALESAQRDIKEFFSGAVEYAEEMRGSCERTEMELQQVTAERNALRKQLATYGRMRAFRQ